MTETLGRDLARALGSGQPFRLRDRYAPGATLEAHLPGGSLQAEGRDAALEALGRSMRAPAQVRVLAERRSRGGSILRLSAEGERAVERRRHLLHLRRGRVVHHVVYPERPPSSVLPPLPAGALAGASGGAGLGRIRSRRALEPGISGCAVERWRLASGRVLFAKHLRGADSWLMRASDDRGREAGLLDAGDLDRVAEVVDHAVIAAVPESGGWLLLSEDRSEALSRPPRTHAARRALLEAIGEVHARFRDRPVPAAGTIAERLAVFSPATARRELEGADLAPKVIGRGWELFGRVAPPDVAEGVMALLERPDPLVRALVNMSGTLLHGDLRPANVGSGAGRPVVLDWGLALTGPSALEAAWWVFNGAWRGGGSLGGLLAEAIAALGPAGGPPERPGRRAVDVCLLAVLVQAGAWFGFEAVQSPDPADRRRAREGLAWWADRARRALGTL